MEYLTEEESSLLQQVSQVAETLIARSGCRMGAVVGTGGGSCSSLLVLCCGSPGSSSPSRLQDPRSSQGSQSRGAGAGTRCQHQLPGAERSPLQQSRWHLGGELGLGVQSDLHPVPQGPAAQGVTPSMPL